MVIKVIREDPFVSIREIKDILNRKYHQKFSWFSIFRVLKKNKILKKRNRFRYIRNVY